ncbi:bacillithiol biosynthesis cysteine-adding enzyme BshC [Paenibacillus thermotolerans]|uniref:bacillithiol biosynthesis cysteine-adding enzyme BshC n=1 Tax=Paenibacillus thermotolerans TaxID=3027807 RepID=UPI002368EA3C|nr:MULTISPECIES: bacillithiol biosynthesis cysteine-adding enzyme BshC [unclassified Paenibacillus]
MRSESYTGSKRPPFVRDVMQNSANAANRFDFSHPYGNIEGLKERAAWLDRPDRPSANRDTLADVLITYNRKHGNAQEAIEAIEKLRRSDTLAVIGGQQAGLFTGPMLVFYKALTVIQAAKAAEAELGRFVIPVFWIAGEDHDWDEVNHTYVLTPQLHIEKIAIHKDEGAAGANRTSVSKTPVSQEQWTAALDALQAALPDTEFKPGMMEQLRDISERSATLSDAFAKTMSLLFGKYGLVLVDSDDENLRKLEAPLFSRLLQSNAELNEAIQAGQSAVAEAGYPLQAEAHKDGLQLFVFHEGERKLLYRDGDRAVDRKGTFSMPLAELERLPDRSPELLSNNALTRPLMQEYLFPTLATVLGPSEIAYWGVLKESFHAFGMRTPVIIPRLEFTLLEGTVQKQMDKFGLTFADAAERIETLRDEWLRGQDELGLSERFAEVKEQFRQVYEPLIRTVAEINGGLRKLGETNMSKILEQIDFLQARSLEAHKSQHEAALRHWERIRLSVSPHGKPQERVYNLFLYAMKYGPDLLDHLMLNPFIDFKHEPPNHCVVYL